MLPFNLEIDQSWKELLEEEFDKDYFKNLSTFLEDEYKNHTIYPSKENIFRAFNATPFDKVKVVIIGQDPYHGEGQAHGLCFSVPEGVKIPPSLVNIYKELERDLGITPSKSGNLDHWTEQGVLLINSVLTVRASQAASHQKKGWEKFTDRVVELLNERRKGVVYMLWGAYGWKKGAKIDEVENCVLKSSHPSPLSVYRGFNGCSHFSLANKYLKESGNIEINW